MFSPGIWYRDAKGTLLQAKQSKSTILEHYFTVTGVKIKTDGSASWNTANEFDSEWTPASEAEVTAALTATQKWLDSQPGEVLAHGVHWTSRAGVDPEVFLEKPDGALVEAFKVLPKKDKPFKYGAAECYWDGFQAEFGVIPHYCHAKLLDRVRDGLQGLLNCVRPTVPDVRLSFKTVVEVSPDTLMNESMEFVQLGCDPSENAYGMMGLQVEEPRELKWRFAGGHYHIDPMEWRGNLNPLVIKRMVKAADVIAAVPAVVMFQKYDSPIRRIYYGLPGEHRVPPHGVEYRVLSNAWMFHPAVSHFSLELVRAGLKLGFRDLAGIFDYDEDRVVKTILNGDVAEARKHVLTNIKAYEWLLAPVVARGLREYGLQEETNAQERVLKAGLAQLQGPIDDFVPLKSMEANWHIDKEDWGEQCKATGAQWQRMVLGL